MLLFVVVMVVCSTDNLHSFTHSFKYFYLILKIFKQIYFTFTGTTTLSLGGPGNSDSNRAEKLKEKEQRNPLKFIVMT